MYFFMASSESKEKLQKIYSDHKSFAYKSKHLFCVVWEYA